MRAAPGALAAVAIGTTAAPPAQRPPAALAGARQLVLVVAGGWDSTAAVLRRYERDGIGAPWRAVGGATPVVLGRTGMAWGAGHGAAPRGAPVKREGDGRSPAGAYPLLHAFAFAGAPVATGLPLVGLDQSTVCVDDPTSPLYNAVVDSAGAGGARWASAEQMRRVAGYRAGVVVGYNGARTNAAGVRTAVAGPATTGRGSCIFLHVWDGPTEPTAGCTAMTAAAMTGVAAWLDARRRPVLVQLTRSSHARLRGAWGLP